MQSHYCLPDMEPSPYREIGVMPEVGGTMACNLEYPEVYYKIQPFVMVVCDQLGRYNMPTQEELLEISDRIYDDVCVMYPDLEDYTMHMEMKSSVETAQRGRGDYYRGGGRFRRRGIFRDFIDILLLNELFEEVGFGGSLTT